MTSSAVYVRSIPRHRGLVSHSRRNSSAARRAAASMSARLDVRAASRGREARTLRVAVPPLPDPGVVDVGSLGVIAAAPFVDDLSLLHLSLGGNGARRGVRP